MEREFTNRRSGRFVPGKSVTAALLHHNVPVAYGVVIDLSEEGACIMTDAILHRDRNYLFRMSFFEGEVLETEARIVWARRKTPVDPKTPVTIPHGLEFTDMAEGSLSNLKRILGSSDFGPKETEEQD